MTALHLIPVFVLPVLVAVSSSAAQDRITAYTGARILPVASDPIDDGVLIVAGGKIQIVGGAGTTIPEGADVVDVSGKVVTPGLVDAGTMLGVDQLQGNEQADEVTPHVRVIDALDPADKRFRRARSQGVTTVQVNPGNRNVIGGLGAVLKTRGDTVQEMLLSERSGLRLTMGSEPSRGNMAIRGGTPTGIYYRRPTTRMGVVWAARKAFYDATAYMERKTVENGDAAPADFDPAMEVLVEVLNKKLIVHTTAEAEQDIRTALRLAAEFGYRTLIEEATEAWRVVEELKEAGVTVLLSAPSNTQTETPTAEAPPSPPGRRRGGFGRGGGAEARYHTLNLLAEAGVPFAIHSGPDLGRLPLVREAMFAVRHGLSPEQALRAVTHTPAELLGVGDRVGALASGMDADFVVWSADPFDPVARADRVVIDGREQEIDS